MLSFDLQPIAFTFFPGTLALEVDLNYLAEDSSPDSFSIVSPYNIQLGENEYVLEPSFTLNRYEEREQMNFDMRAYWERDLSIGSIRLGSKILQRNRIGADEEINSQTRISSFLYLKINELRFITSFSMMYLPEQGWESFEPSLALRMNFNPSDNFAMSTIISYRSIIDFNEETEHRVSVRARLNLELDNVELASETMFNYNSNRSSLSITSALRASMFADVFPLSIFLFITTDDGDISFLNNSDS